MGIKENIYSLKSKLEIYKDHLAHISKNRRVFEDENNINTTIKYLFETNNLGKNYVKLFNIGNDYMNFIKTHRITESNNKKTKISKEDLIYYSKKVLESAHPSLIEELDGFNLNGSIIFNNKIKRALTRNKISSMSIRKINRKNQRKLKYTININEEITFDTVKTFVHEYMHYISGNNVPKNEYGGLTIYKKNLNEQKYGEFISIYFEEYAKNYMVENFNIPNEEFDNTFRITDTKLQDHYRSIYLPFAIYYNYGEYSYKNYKEFIENNDVDMNPSYEGFIKNKKKFLNSFSEIIVLSLKYKKNADEHPNLYNDKNKESFENLLKETLYKNNYVLGTLLAFYVKDKITPKEMAAFAKMINKNDKTNMYKDPLYKKVDYLYDEVMDGKFDYDILVNHLKSNNNLEKGVNL